MNHSEIRELFEKKLKEACDTIRETKNGDQLSITKYVSYIDDKLVEKQDYNGKSDTSIVVSAMIFEKGKDSEEDPSYEISLLCDLHYGNVKNPEELQRELQSFDEELERFLAALSSCESVSSFIREEDERLSSEGKKVLAEMEASIAKMKKFGFIGVIVLLGIVLLFTLLK